MLERIADAPDGRRPRRARRGLRGADPRGLSRGASPRSTPPARRRSWPPRRRPPGGWGPFCAEHGADLFLVQSQVSSARHLATGYEPLALAEFTRLMPIPGRVGNTTSYDAALELMRQGAAAIFVGVGPGAACTTRDVLGIGVPQVTAIADVAAARDDYFDQTGRYVPVVADGGMRRGGELAKAIAAGADVLMLGSPLARAAEAPGRGTNWGMAAPSPTLPRGTRIKVGTVGLAREDPARARRSVDRRHRRTSSARCASRWPRWARATCARCSRSRWSTRRPSRSKASPGSEAALAEVGRPRDRRRARRMGQGCPAGDDWSESGKTIKTAVGFVEGDDGTHLRRGGQRGLRLGAEPAGQSAVPRDDRRSRRAATSPSELDDGAEQIAGAGDSWSSSTARRPSDSAADPCSGWCRPTVTETLTERRLNRALLARQRLLEPSGCALLSARAGRWHPDAVRPSGYIGLWTRMANAPRSDLTHALESREVIQATLMRMTIHTVSARDYWPMAVAVRESRRDWLARVNRRAMAGLDMEAAGRTRCAASSARPVEAGRAVRTAEGSGVPDVPIGWVSLWLDLVRVPPSGTWESRRADVYGLADMGPATQELTVEDAVGSAGAAGTWMHSDPLACPTSSAGPASRATDRSRRHRKAGRRPLSRRGCARSWWTARRAAAARRHARAGQVPADLGRHAARTRSPHTDPAREIPSAGVQHRMPQSIGTFLVDGQVAGTWRYDEQWSRSRLADCPHRSPGS